MSDNNLEHLFENLKNDFDIEAPRLQHEQRFVEKLNNQKSQISIVKNNAKRNSWKPFVGIAASIILLFGIFIGLQQSDTVRDLASVSPEMAKTQDFFTSTITTELAKIQNETAPEAQSLIQDAMKQMNVLVANYESLKQDLTTSQDDNRVIYAMISNFQNRIELLENVLQQIENVKHLKNTNYENSITI